jgi:pimeloyl-ACP methyl ester carboxylesterase
MTSAKTGTTVVLAHAAWADGSSWNKVTGELQRKGFEVVAAQIPLTLFADDVAVLKTVLLQEKGPIVLAGHSYGGAVVTAAAAGNSNVKALVYIAAIVPDEGETVADRDAQEHARDVRAELCGNWNDRITRSKNVGNVRITPAVQLSQPHVHVM